MGALTVINLRIVAVGKLKEKFWTDAVNEYKKRIGRYANLEIIECPEGRDEGNAERLAVQEERAILEKAQGFVVLTAIDGEQITSEGLSELISKESVGGTSTFTFIIGGSRGVSEAVKRRADKKISFGRVTYPHQLMRVILSEQLYRAMSIINKTSYHK